MVRHVVMFQLGGDADKVKAAAESFKQALEALPEVIDELQAIEVGINANPSEQWHVVLTATLPDMAAVATYAAHPAHVACTKLIAEVKRARACVDYVF